MGGNGVGGGAATLRPDPHSKGGGTHGDGADDGVGRRVDHPHVGAALVGDVGAVDGRVHSHTAGARPHGNGGADEGVERRIDHRHVVAVDVGDVGAVDGGVHSHTPR